MKLVICEKPSVARDIAKVLGVKGQKDGYFENNEWQISWAFGHLVELLHPDAYDKSLEKWRMDDLPFIPDEFKKAIVKNDGAQRQFETIQALCQQENLESVICATDAGREGELIFRHIYTMSSCTKPIQRLWISSQTDQAIKDGFANLKPGEDYNPLYDSALSRSEADWIVGINATRAYTITFSGGSGVMSVGRVQTPVLKLIVDRFVENKNFEPKNYWEIIAQVKHPNGEYEAKWEYNKEDRTYDESVAVAAMEALNRQKAGLIDSVSNKEKKEKQPLLYDLTELQKDANRQFKYSADQTLKLAQSLYEKHKILSYPRTSSRYLSKDIEPQLLGRLSLLSDISKYTPIIDEILELKGTMAKRMIDDKKVTDHHAIIPTDKRPNIGHLSTEEKNVYDLVIKRFLAAFLPECVKSHSEIVTSFGEHRFKSTGTIILKLGWRRAYQGEELKESKKSKKEPDEKLLPDVIKGDSVTHTALNCEKKQTKAPPLYNEASLLAAMETAGKTIDDEDLRQAMKDCGLGTPATRAQIIERLLKVGYILREKNRFVATNKGVHLIDSIQDPALASPELTGEWESQLNKMAQGEFQRETFMKGIKDFTFSFIEALRGKAPISFNPNKETIAPCPLCEHGKVVESKLSYHCNSYKETGCKFVIWKTTASKEVSLKQAKDLLKKGETSVIKGFKSRAGKTFNAALKLEQGKVVFKFDNDKGECPLCQGRLTDLPKSVSCSNWKTTGCKFTIWKVIAGKKLTDKHIDTLLKKGKTPQIKGFKSRKGDSFDAELELKEGQVKFAF